VSYFVDRGHERPLVSFRWLVEAADLPDELQRSSPNLLVGSWGIEVEQGSNVSAHSQSLRLSNRNKNVQFYNILYEGVNPLTRIVADDLQNGEASSLVEYMTAMSSGQVTQHKKIIEVTGLTNKKIIEVTGLINKKIKFLLHKFLYTRHPCQIMEFSTLGETSR
jgi:hypothetical protein